MGRTRDKSVIWTWEVLGDVLYTREIYVMSNESYEVQAAAFDKRMQLLRPARAYIDQGTIGHQMAETMTKRYPGRVAGMQLTDHKMAELANQLAVALERCKVRIPIDRDLHDDFANVPPPVTRSGRDAMQTSKRSETGHADRFWAAALGYDAAQVPVYRRRRAVGAS